MQTFEEQQARLTAEREARMLHDELLTDELIELNKFREYERNDNNGNKD